MPLPTISTPTYELTLPSSNRKIKYRPFLVKEEKIKIISYPTTPLPHSSSEQLARNVMQLQEDKEQKKGRSKCGSKKNKKRDQ